MPFAAVAAAAPTVVSTGKDIFESFFGRSEWCKTNAGQTVNIPVDMIRRAMARAPQAAHALRQRLLSMGGDGWPAKPFTPEQLAYAAAGGKDGCNTSAEGTAITNVIASFVRQHAGDFTPVAAPPSAGDQIGAELNTVAGDLWGVAKDTLRSTVEHGLTGARATAAGARAGATSGSQLAGFSGALTPGTLLIGGGLVVGLIMLSRKGRL